MPQFVLLLRDNPSVFADLSAEEMQAIIGRYTAWSEKLSNEGKLAPGNQKLRDGEGKVMVKRDGGVSITDGPYVESKEVMGGFFMILASDYDEAVRISSDCPHLEFGSIELRQIDEIH